MRIYFSKRRYVPLKYDLITDLSCNRDRAKMIFRRLRRFLKARLKRYPAAFRVYDAISWTFTRSPFGRTAKRFFPHISNIIFPMWAAPRLRLARDLAVDGKVEKAIAIADDVLARKPDLYDFRFNYIASIYWLQGRYEDGLRVFERMEERRREVARELQYDRLGLRFFSGVPFTAIGHLGMLDKYIKAEILGIMPRRTNVILGPPKDFSNSAYVRYWEKYFSRITEPRTISLLAPLIYPLQEQLTVIRVGDRTRSHLEFGAEVQSRWEAEGRGPLLELSAEHRERGYRLLRELGVPEGAWLVGLHVRDVKDLRRDVRNADITTYRLAIEEIANRGGWVLRMGDRSMRPLPSWPNTIDYAHIAKRQDWMDVFLWAEGRFFVGAGSGPQMIPTTFGKPVAIANYGPIPTIVCGKDDVLLPKHYWHESERRYLTMAERLSPDYGFRESLGAFAAMGIRVADNTPEELRELVIEMMDRLEDRHAETEHERALQARFAELAAAHGVYPARIARVFVSKHRDLFDA
jgi:putative glycosyltransferase (TIGR04372 family)